MLKQVTGGLGVVVLLAWGGHARADFLNSGQLQSEFAQLNAFFGQVLNDPAGALDALRSLQQDLSAGGGSLQDVLSQLAADLSNPSALKADLAALGLLDLVRPEHGWKADFLVAFLLFEALLEHRHHHHHHGDPPVFPLLFALFTSSFTDGGGTGHGADVAPEPGSFTLLALGAGLGGLAWRRRRALA